MKIKQIGEYTGDIISTVLRNRGIEDIETFLNPSISNYKTDVEGIINMEKGVEAFLAHLNANSKIGLLVDSDTDGFTSSAILYRFIQEFTGGYDNITYYLHSVKTHGLTDAIMRKIQKDEIQFMIIADSSTNDIAEIEELYQRGVEVLVIDHHEAEEGYEESRAVLINNQLDETNKNFVGAGMVLNFLRVVAQYTHKPIASKHLDLVAVGQIADQSDIAEPEIRGIVFHGLRNINNPFLLQILKEKGIDHKKCTPKDIAFSVSPLINAVTRIGSLEERELIFRAFASINDEERFFVNKKKKNPTTGKFDQIVVEMNLYENAVDTALKLKGKQDRTIKKEMESVKETVITLGGVGIGFISEEAKGMTGLIASRMVSSYQIPFLICHKYEADGVYRGSGRGCEKVLKDLKEWCQGTGHFNFVQGHANAFGFEIEIGKLDYVKELSREIAVENVYEVDLIVDGKIDHSLVPTLDKYKEIFGGKVKEPLIAMTGISVNKKLISHKGTTLKFYEDKMSFVMFGAEFDMDYLDTFRGDRVVVDFVGKLGYNTWNNMKTPQMVITDYVIKEEQPKEITIENIVF